MFLIWRFLYRLSLHLQVVGQPLPPPLCWATCFYLLSTIAAVTSLNVTRMCLTCYILHVDSARLFLVSDEIKKRKNVFLMYTGVLWRHLSVLWAFSSISASSPDWCSRVTAHSAPCDELTMFFKLSVEMTFIISRWRPETVLFFLYRHDVLISYWTLKLHIIHHLCPFISIQLVSVKPHIKVRTAFDSITLFSSF